MKFFILTLILSATFASSPKLVSDAKFEIAMKEPNFEDQAFAILSSKCNVCHEVKNKRRVFTKENMAENGKRIYKQVFVWKRMPKGRDITLTTEEYNQLKQWLASINIK